MRMNSANVPIEVADNLAMVNSDQNGLRDEDELTVYRTDPNRAHRRRWVFRWGGSSFTLRTFPGTHFCLQTACAPLLQAISQEPMWSIRQRP
jgi:hypothetical protein